MFLSAVFSSKLFEKAARLSSKNLADKRAPFTSHGGRTRLRRRTSSSTSGLCSLGSSAFQTSVSVCALSCLSCSSTAHFDSSNTTGRQGDYSVVRQQRKGHFFSKTEAGQNGKKISWNALLCIFIFPLVLYTCLCIWRRKNQ